VRALAGKRVEKEAHLSTLRLLLLRRLLVVVLLLIVLLILVISVILRSLLLGVGGLRASDGLVDVVL
jgi:hypothetical protein